MENLVLSKNAEIACFKNDAWPGRAGITTVNFGTCQLKDNPKEVEHNRLLAKLTGSNFFSKIRPEHQDKVEFIKYFGKRDYFDCDALIFIKKSFFNEKTQPLLLSNTADCPTIVLYHNNHADDGIGALIHSGWKGTQKNIVGKTVRIIRGKFPQRDLNLYAFVWPGICVDCYEVGPKFGKYFPGLVHKGHLNLKAIIIEQLQNAGVKKIVTTDACSAHTMHNNQFLFHSFRRDKTPQRNCIFFAV